MKPAHNICLTCSVIAELLVLAQAFYGSIGIEGTKIIGERALINCDYVTTPGERLQLLYVWPTSYNRHTREFFFLLSDEKDVYYGSAYNNRLSLTHYNYIWKGTQNKIGLVTMKIENLQCSDELLYGCTFVYRTGSFTSRTTYKVNQSLTLRALPSKADISVQRILNRQAVKGRSYIVAKCRAVVGRPGLGTIRWFLWRGRDLEIISKGDIRVRNLTKWSRYCVLYMEQSLTVEIKSSQEVLRFACYAQNSDLNAGESAEECHSVRSELCGITQEVSLPPADEDVAAIILVAALVLVAGFVTAVILDLVYHCFCTQAPPPKQKQPKQAKRKKSEQMFEPKVEEMGEDESIFDNKSDDSGGTQV